MVEVLKPRGFKEERSDDALVAQWIERLVAVQKVAGSIPAKRTKIKVSIFYGNFYFLLLGIEQGKGSGKLKFSREGKY